MKPYLTAIAMLAALLLPPHAQAFNGDDRAFVRIFISIQNVNEHCPGYSEVEGALRRSATGVSIDPETLELLATMSVVKLMGWADDPKIKHIPKAKLLIPEVTETVQEHMNHVNSFSSVKAYCANMAPLLLKLGFVARK
jgi:hypothetical protein